MQNAQVRPVRDLRNRYTEIEALIENHDPVIITKNGRGAAVLINIDDYAEVEEYLHIKYVNSKLRTLCRVERSCSSRLSKTCLSVALLEILTLGI